MGISEKYMKMDVVIPSQEYLERKTSVKFNFHMGFAEIMCYLPKYNPQLFTFLNLARRQQKFKKQNGKD